MVKLAHFTQAFAPSVSREDLERFSGFATIRDEIGFADTLRAFIIEKSPAAKGKSTQGPAPDIMTRLREKVSALTAERAWEPSETDLQRGRAQMLREFNTPKNLPLARFAKLANKSRQQVYNDVAAKRLLSISIGSRGQRIPDWQLDGAALDLTQKLLAKAEGVDEWTLFHAMTSPMESLRGKSAVEAANKSNLDKVLSAVLNDLGIHG
jgi:hypothetical protein